MKTLSMILILLLVAATWFSAGLAVGKKKQVDNELMMKVYETGYRMGEINQLERTKEILKGGEGHNSELTYKKDSLEFAKLIFK